MVLILTSEEDITSSEVLKWLYHFKQDFIRINGKDDIRSTNLTIGLNDDITFTINNQDISLKDIKSYWYRRGRINLDQHRRLKPIDDKESQTFLFETLHKEIKVVEDFFYHLLDGKKSIGSFAMGGINKLYALNMAKSAGLTVPDTLITGDKKQLSKFLKKHGSVITKAIFEVPTPRRKDYSIWAYTSIFDEQLLEDLPIDFFPSLFQQKVDKKYELRIFYLNEKCYPTAIFSQQDEQTSVDFRNYNHQNPNRRVPFTIPGEIEEKIKKFMLSIDLNCGSLDVILTPDNDFVFLEVNPVGQFGFTSYVANYRLEKEIALSLMNQS